MTIFRYKFDETVVLLMNEFTQIHKYDETVQFREAWDKFIKDNRAVIDRENRRLVKLGYDGDVPNKMYKSVRYYFKNKSNSKTETKKRRKYVTLDKDFLGDMDKHIANVAFKQDMKPAYAYNNFISDNTYSHKLDDVALKLLNDGFLGPAIETKFKKTYKNRYFIRQKKD